MIQINGKFVSSGGVFEDIAELCKNDKRDFFEHEVIISKLTIRLYFLSTMKNQTHSLELLFKRL